MNFWVYFPDIYKFLCKHFELCDREFDERHYDDTLAEGSCNPSTMVLFGSSTGDVRDLDLVSRRGTSTTKKGEGEFRQLVPE